MIYTSFGSYHFISGKVRDMHLLSSITGYEEVTTKIKGMAGTIGVTLAVDPPPTTNWNGCYIPITVTVDSERYSKVVGIEKESIVSIYNDEHLAFFMMVYLTEYFLRQRELPDKVFTKEIREFTGSVDPKWTFTKEPEDKELTREIQSFACMLSGPMGRA